ncbi:hypothetical protein C2S51_029959 [Perilla frutescens var. frutescens]|nr:hypothetical protein C2S51_029959 [Perilla frutescens var. frutescens]
MVRAKEAANKTVDQISNGKGKRAANNTVDQTSNAKARRAANNTVDQISNAKVKRGKDKRQSKSASVGNDAFPKLNSRAIPGELALAIKSMTNEQKSAIVEMGFAQLLHLNIDKVPARLVYWVLDKFDASSSEIVIDVRRIITVDVDDVQSVLGFSNGGEKIKTRRRSDICNMKETWYDQFTERGRGRIMTKHVRVAMMNDKDGGDKFKMNFLVLLTSCMIENSVNGYVSPLLLNYMDKLDSIHEMDWCDYVVRSLITHKVIWEKNMSNDFGGPIVFLTVIYST